MHYSKVLLVNPPSKGEWKGFRPHIGLGYIAEYLHDNRIEYDILDMNLGYKFKHLKKKIDAFKPDVVGMSLLTLEYKKFYGLLSLIKEGHPGVKTVVGGPHVTLFGDQVMRECAAIDYAVLYEGEETLMELCRGDLPDDQIKGLLSKTNGTVVYPGDRPFIADLDTLSFPRYEKFELTKYIPEVEIYSTRGCPHECIFCTNRIISPVYRMRSPRHVVDEMEYWYNKGYRQYNFDDDNFNKDMERVYQICDEIEKRGLKHLFIRCSNGIRADCTDRALLSRMKEVGFNYIAFGADAGNNKMLRLNKKGETLEDIDSALKNASDLGYNLKLLFVVGTPGETWQDVEDDVSLALKYPLQDVHFYNIIPFPGTELYKWVADNNRFLLEPEYYLNEVTFNEIRPIFDTPELSKEDRLRLFKYLAEVRKEVHRRAVQRMVGNVPVIGFVIQKIVSTDLFLKLFYQNFSIRRFVDRQRYRWAVRRSPN